MLAPGFRGLRAILVLGGDGWNAVNGLRLLSGRTVLETLGSAGKLVINLPHPSGQNAEYVALASLRPEELLSCEEYVKSASIKISAEQRGLQSTACGREFLLSKWIKATTTVHTPGRISALRG
jgi:hypothetical protein